MLSYGRNMDVEEPLIASDEKAKGCRSNDAIKNLKVNYYICRYNYEIYSHITFHMREPFYTDLRRAAPIFFFSCKQSKQRMQSKEKVDFGCLHFVA